MISSKLPNVTTSIFSVMSQMANQYDAINLAQGFPNFESDPVLIALVNKAMRDGKNQYAPMPGHLGLRENIAIKVSEMCGSTYHPEHEITITAGATQAIFTAISAVIQRGDEVIIFTPAYDCYAPTIELYGGKVVPVQLQPPSYRPNWDEVRQKVNPKTRMIVVNSPHNPSGMLFTKNDMEQLQDIAVTHNLLVLSDEVYEHIIFDGEIHQSAAKFNGLKERTFITASFGKTFHNTGWKIGYCLAPEMLTKEFRKVHQYTVFSINHPMQVALSEYLETPEHYLQLPAFYEAKRDLFLSSMADSNFTMDPSKGTYFQLLGFEQITDENDVAFAERLIKEHGIATIPTSVFNANQEDFKHVRVCFAKTDAVLQNATAILCGIR
ncbi:MAG: methionine aminotransferase [Marinirhabdus sp.]|nr:methionine aminotransferase [Marinirhabdus sp.]